MTLRLGCSRVYTGYMLIASHTVFINNSSQLTITIFHAPCTITNIICFTLQYKMIPIIPREFKNSEEKTKFGTTICLLNSNEISKLCAASMKISRDERRDEQTDCNIGRPPSVGQTTGRLTVIDIVMVITFQLLRRCSLLQRCF